MKVVTKYGYYYIAKDGTIFHPAAYDNNETKLLHALHEYNESLD